MKGASEVLMGATLIMAATLAVVLGLVFVLLAELYCSLLLRRRQTICNSDSTAAAAAVSATPATTASPASNTFHPHCIPPAAASPLSSFYSQGVLRAPRSLLFPALSYPEADHAQTEPKSEEFVSITVPKHLMYISNPIYDGTKSEDSTTPFETPDSSPSRLGAAASSSTPVEVAVVVMTPPLTPMKKLPATACSVGLRDVRSSLCTSCSDSNTNLGLLSSSSGTPCTSPSW